jgi:hypothetical protein
MTWIGACLVAAFLLGAMLGSAVSRQREDTQRDHSHSDKLDYPTEANHETSIAALARAQIALAKDANAADKRQSSYNKRSHRISFWTAVGVGSYTVFTAVIVIFSIIQFGETHRFNKKQLRFLNAQLAEMHSSSAQTDQTIAALKEQAKIMAGQLNVSRDEFTATNRPWISIDDKPTISSPLTHLPGGDISLSLNFILRNSGSTPAIHVSQEVIAVIGTTFSLHQIVSTITGYCEEIKVAKFSPTETGILVPPGIPIKNPSHNDVIIKKDYINSTKVTIRGREAIVPHSGGCVNYQFTFGEKIRHQIGFIYQLIGPETAIFLDVGDIAADKLDLVPQDGEWTN